MDSRDRLWATVAVWGALTTIVMAIVAGLTIAQPDLPVEAFIAIVFAILFIAGMAGLSTMRIWRGAVGQSSMRDRGDLAAKSKRVASSRIERLVEDLDSDEIVELETLLLSRDDELDRIGQ